MSFAKPVFHLFNSSILKVKDDDTDLSRALKCKILEYLNWKYSDLDIQAFYMAFIVDPRFKMRYIAEDNTPSVQSRLKAEMQTVAVMVLKITALWFLWSLYSHFVLIEFSVFRCHPFGATAHENTEGGAEAGCAPKKKMTLGSYFKTADQAWPPNNQEPSGACELESYLQSSCLDSEGETLKWWKEHRKIYSRLLKVAKKIAVHTSFKLFFREGF